MLHDEDRIRIRAHQIWERQGCPDGLAATHWQMAQEELAMEDSLTDPAAPETAAVNGGVIDEKAALAAISVKTRSRRKQNAAPEPRPSGA
jgi:hypothetical protein